MSDRNEHEARNASDSEIEHAYLTLLRCGNKPTPAEVQHRLKCSSISHIQRALERLELNRFDEDQIEGDLLQVFSDKLQPIVHELYTMVRGRSDSRIEETHNTYSKQLHNAEVELGKALAKIDAAQGRIWDTEKQLTEKSFEHRTVAARFEALSHDMDVMRPAHREAITRVEILQEEIDILNRHIEGHASEMNALTEETNRYAKLFSVAQEKLSETEKKNAQLEEQLRHTQEQNELLSTQRAAAEEKVIRNDDGRLEHLMQAVMQLQGQLGEIGVKPE